MFLRLSKAAIAAIALLTALPAIAGDGNTYRPHGFHGRPGISFNARPHRFPAAIGFTAFDRGDRGRRHIRPLREIYTSQPRYVRNTVILAPRLNEPGVSNGYYSDGYYDGAGYAYSVRGGTYVSGFGYAPYRTEPRQTLAPKAKVIDVAVADDPCSYEANVCVIRP